jgi:hypothetical protein
MSEPFVDASSETIDCGTFEATLERSYAGTLTTFFDRNGEPIRIQFVARLIGSLSSDDGRVIDLSGSVLVVIDLVAGTFTFDGNVFFGNEPGQGVVLQDTGKFLVGDGGEFLVAGPHDAIETDGAIFCLALR